MLRRAYLHDYDEGHFGSKDMPELHIMRVFLWVIRGISVISIPEKYIYEKLATDSNRETS